jgi:hypothetical protein
MITEEHLDRGVGVLAGVHILPRWLTEIHYNAGFRDADTLTTMVAVSLAESQGYTEARNDNLNLITQCWATQKVRNVETYELVTVLNPSTGQIRLSDGEVVVVPLTTEWITSRDCGIDQINIPAEFIGTPTETALYDPDFCARQAHLKYVDRNFTPWVAYTTGVFMHDSYVLRACLGMLNMQGKRLTDLAMLDGQITHIRTPIISFKEIRVLYPDVKGI